MMMMKMMKILEDNVEDDCDKYNDVMIDDDL